MKTLSIREPGWRPFLGQVAIASARRPRRRLGDAATALTDDNFDQALKAQTAVVDFWSPECLPCVRSKPIFDDIATNPPGNLFMGTVNADEAKGIVAKYNIESLPTQIYFVNGVEVNRNEGAFTRDGLLAAIAQLPGPQPAVAAQPQPEDQVMPPSSTTTPATPSAPTPAAAPAPQQQAPAQTTAAPLPPPPKPSPAAALPSTAPPVQVPQGISSTTLVVGAASILAVGAGIFLLTRP